MDNRAAVLMSGSELLAAYDALQDEITERQARQAQLLDRLDAMGYAKEVGAHDTARLLTDRYRLDPAEAHRRVQFATQLHKYPVVAAALPTPGTTDAGSDGDGTTDDEGGGSTTHGDGDGTTDGDGITDGEGCGSATHGDGDGTADGDGDGGGVVLHLAQAEAIVSALEKIPASANVPVEDLAEAELRMVQAARNLPPAALRKLGVQVRNILDTDGSEPREDAARKREDVWVRRADGGVKFGGYLAAENAEALETVLQVGAKPHKTETGGQDPRSRGKRQADALVDALNLALGSGEMPGHGGIKPHITVTIDLNDLIEAGKNATGDLVFGDGLSAGAVRRLACDAGIIPVVLGSESELLDVGREFRFVTTPGLRNALNLRDRGCVVCGAPPIYCAAHHLTSWLDGGVTSLANTVLLCRVHHTALHQGHWTITIVDNQVQVSSPTWANRHPGRHRKPTPPSTTAPTTATATATCPTDASPAGMDADTRPTDASPSATAAGTCATDSSPTGIDADTCPTDSSPTGRGADICPTDSSPAGRGAVTCFTDASPAGMDADTCPTDASPAGRGADVHRLDAPPAATAAGTCPPSAKATATCTPPPTVGGETAASTRAWPYTDDITWITPEEAAALNPWGDEPDTADVLPLKFQETAQFDPWADSA